MKVKELIEELEGKTMKIRLIDSMEGREGKSIRILVDGKEMRRRVYYRTYCGLFILVKGYMVFAYDFYSKDELELNIEVEGRREVT